MDLERAARNALGGTGADCAAWVRRARGRARREERPLQLADLMIEIGVDESGAYSERKHRAAIHESGHALVANQLGLAITSISLRDSSEGTDGITRICASNSGTAEAMGDLLTIGLAGRAAEVLVFGTPSAGAAHDLQTTTAICREMYCRWGLGNQLSVCDATRPPNDINEAVERALRAAMKKAFRQLSTHRMDLRRLADALLKRGSLERAEIELILTGK